MQLSPKKKEKALLREEMTKKVSLINDEAKDAFSETIAHEALDFILKARRHHILLFASLPSEPQIERLWELSTSLSFYYPRVEGKELSIYRVAHPEELKKQTYDLREPDPAKHQKIPPQNLEMLLIPGVAFAKRDGTRLGRAGGYYDRFLSGIPPSIQRVGVCFDLQTIDTVPREKHDQAVDFLITEKGLFSINQE